MTYLFRRFFDKQYQILSTLRGPQDAVTSLSFSSEAKFLAAAGTCCFSLSYDATNTLTGPGGVNVWNVDTLEAVPMNSQQELVQHPERVPVPVTKWLRFTQQPRHLLLLGAWDGSVQVWDYNDDKKASLLLFASLSILP